MLPDAAGAVLLAKMRVFVDFRGFSCRVRFVPLVIVDEIDDALLVRILLSTPGLSPVGANLVAISSRQSRHRLLQLLMSSIFAAAFFAEARRRHGALWPVISFDHEAAELQFGAAASDLFMQQFERASAQPLGGRTTLDPAFDAEWQRPTSAAMSDPKMREPIGLVRAMLERYGLPPRPGKGQLLYLGQSIVEPVARLFWAIDIVRERPERKAVRNLSWTAFVSRYRTSAARKLNHGVRLDEIADLFGNVQPDNYWRLCVASFAIDVCNDVGIAVPASLVDESSADAVARRFRVGENSWTADTRDDAVPTTWLSPRFGTRSTTLRNSVTLDEPSAADRQAFTTLISTLSAVILPDSDAAVG
jgi:hypothetical protein